MNGRRIFALVGLALAVIILTGCGDAATWTPERSWNNDGTQGTADALSLDRFGTMAAIDVAERQMGLDATAQAAVVQATMEAQRAAWEVQRIAGTRQAEAATAQAWDRAVQSTQTAANATAQVEAARYETAEARRIEETAEARRIEETRQAVAIEATRQRAQWEQDATATAWARADMATQEASYATRQAEATAAIDRATQQSHQATATRAAAIREERLGGFRDYGLPVILLLLVGGLVALVVWGVRQWSKRPIVYERSLLGDAQPMAVPQISGGFAFVDLDRQPGPVLQVLPNGDVNAPQLRSAAQEERTTRADQYVDSITRPRLGSGHSSTPPQLPTSAPPEAPAPGLTGVRILRRLEQAETAGLLPAGQIESIETIWKETDE